MGFAHLYVGHKLPHLGKRAQGGACSNGGFTNPTLGQTIDSLQPLNISWDTTCLTDVQTIDIVLSAPGNNRPLLQGWQNVNFAAGYRVVGLLPRKWNDTASQQLQLTLYQSGTPSFMSPLPAGPVFTATYSAPSNAKVPAAADMSLENGNAAASVHAKSSHGKIAAGVLLPLILLIAAFLAYIRIKRRHGKEKRKRWSEMVDKRMSTISTDWKSMSAAGAQAAIRHSMAVSTRNSSFSFGAIRPPSMAVEPTSPDMAQIRRPGTGLRNAALAHAVASGERVSRVSFADTGRVSRVSFAADPRPSTESRRTVGTVGSSRASRAFHSAYTPPVPSLPPTYSPKEKVKDNADDVDVTLSPRQTAGPLTLSPDDIRARIQNGQAEKDDDMADVMPALSMMRTGSADNNLLSTTVSSMAQIDEEDDYLLPPSAGAIRMPEPTYYGDANVSSIAPSFPIPQIPQMDYAPHSADAMTPLRPATTTAITPPVPALTPDDMLRVYAEHRAANMSPGPSRSNTASPFNTPSKRSSPERMLRAYAERGALDASPGPNRGDNQSPFNAKPSPISGTPDDMLRAYAERRGAHSSSPGGRLEKRPSLSASIGGFAVALTKKGRRKDRESRTVTPVSVSKPMPVATISSSYHVADNAEPQFVAGNEASTYLARAGSVGGGAHGPWYTIGDDETYGGTA